VQWYNNLATSLTMFSFAGAEIKHTYFIQILFMYT